MKHTIITLLVALLLAPLAVFADASSLPATTHVPDGKRLRDIVAAKYPKGNVFVGAAINGPMTNPGVDFEILNREFSYTTPENDFKQIWIHPEPGNVWRWE